MNRDKAGNCLIGGVLAFLASFGSLGCLASGFGLNVDMTSLFLCCGFLSAVCAGCFYIPRGGILLLCLGALTTGYLWHSQDLTGQLLGLCYELTCRYDSAYGVGVFGTRVGELTWLLQVAAGLVALCVSYCVCCRKSATLGVTAMLLPVMLCLVVTDTVPDSGYLLCCLFSMLLITMTSYLRRLDTAQGVKLSWMLSLPLLLGLGLLFLLIPREGYDKHPEQIRQWIVHQLEDVPESLGDWVQDAASYLDGSARQETVDLSRIGPMKELEFPVMDVVAPENGVLYLREQDYDFYDGTDWIASDRRTEEFACRDDLDWQEAGTVTIATRRSRALLVFPYYPGEDQELVAGNVENEDRKSAYEITQYKLPGNWHTIATGPAAIGGGILFPDGTLSGEGESKRYLGLPEATRKGLEPILEEILSGQTSSTEIADAVASYVRRSAVYDLDTQTMPESETDFALWFLENSDTGYCVHFATATTVLLRAAGVESRYVTGYMVSVRAGEKVTVTGGDAHAWVEYYEPRLGTWIVLESTPGDFGGEPEHPETEPATQGQTLPNQTTPPETQAPTLPSAPSGNDGTPLWEGLRNIFLTAAALLLVLLAILALPLRRRWILWKRQKAGEQGPNVRALVLWEQAELFARHLKVPVPEDVEQLAEKARFSQHTLTEQELAHMEAHLDHMRSLCREKPWPVRLMYRYGYVLD